AALPGRIEPPGQPADALRAMPQGRDGPAGRRTGRTETRRQGGTFSGFQPMIIHQTTNDNTTIGYVWAFQLKGRWQFVFTREIRRASRHEPEEAEAALAELRLRYPKKHFR